MIHMRNLMTGCLLAAFLCAASCGCSKDNGGGEEGGQVAGVTVKPAYNKSEVLHNPLNGWVMYVRAAVPSGVANARAASRRRRT